MPGGADERSRVLGGLVCLGAIMAGALFLYGLTVKSYWALALPLAALVLFGLQSGLDTECCAKQPRNIVLIVSDDQGYLEAIGRKRNAEVLRDAQISEAEADAEARQVSAEPSALTRPSSDPRQHPAADHRHPAPES